MVSLEYYLIVAGVGIALLFGFLVKASPKFNIFFWEVILGQVRFIAEMKQPAADGHLIHIKRAFKVYPKKKDVRTFNWMGNEFEYPDEKSDVKQYVFGHHPVYWYQDGNQTVLTSDKALPDEDYVESKRHLALERSNKREFINAQKRGLDWTAVLLVIGLVVGVIGTGYYYSQTTALQTDLKYVDANADAMGLKISYYEYWMANHGGIPNVPSGWNGTVDNGGGPIIVG